MAKKRVYDDDDGRTIADMSGVGRPGMVSFRPGTDRGNDPQAQREAPGGDSGLGPFESKRERRMYIMGALRAALLIALVFILGLGLITALMLFIWN